MRNMFYQSRLDEADEENGNIKLVIPLIPKITGKAKNTMVLPPPPDEVPKRATVWKDDTEKNEGFL